MSVANLPESVSIRHSRSIHTTSSQPVHPLGSKAKVLLCSVFGPYAQDDEYGSRVINPMELWHNQVTRVQGPFSLRMFHRSWGLMFIQANIQAPCTCLDFATLDRFIQELADNTYDIIGISAIVPNLRKVQAMCKLIRKHQPRATIVIGGHISNLPDLAQRTKADHVVRGEGVKWFRGFLGEDTEAPLRHPQIWSGVNRRSLGVRLSRSPRNSAAALIPSVGCPIGCNFCSTSAMFGGKGKCIDFFPTAEALYAVMCQLEGEMKIRSFFVMDENFLLNRRRAMGLLALMRRDNKAWAMYVFSSANALRQYTMDELVALGISWVWIGLEGQNSQYGKLNQTNTHDLVRQLQDNGIRVQGSTIVGLEEHTPDNIDEAIAYAVAHDADFHQFMLYTPVAGTPLYFEHKAKGTLLTEDEIAHEDAHGQYRFNFRHPHITGGRETEFLLRAFEEDFRINGPSVLRAARTALKGWLKHRNHPEARVRDRVAWEIEGMGTIFAGSVWAARKWFSDKDNKPLAQRLGEQLSEIIRHFGLKARLSAPTLGRFIHWTISREARRLADGVTHEPPTFYERNYRDANDAVAAKATIIQSVPGLAKETAAAVR